MRSGIQPAVRSPLSTRPRQPTQWVGFQPSGRIEWGGSSVNLDGFIGSKPWRLSFDDTRKVAVGFPLSGGRPNTHEPLELGAVLDVTKQLRTLMQNDRIPRADQPDYSNFLTLLSMHVLTEKARTLYSSPGRQPVRTLFDVNQVDLAAGTPKALEALGRYKVGYLKMPDRAGETTVHQVPVRDRAGRQFNRLVVVESTRGPDDRPQTTLFNFGEH
jgi:hypothetical protein